MEHYLSLNKAFKGFFYSRKLNYMLVGMARENLSHKAATT